MKFLFRCCLKTGDWTELRLSVSARSKLADFYAPLFLRAARIIVSSAVTLLLIAASAYAQENQGAVAFVNAVPLETPTEILVNGTSIKPTGFETGRVTSFIAIPGSSTEIKGRNGDITQKPLIITPSPAGSSIIVVYLVEIPKRDGETSKELRVTSVSSSANSQGFNQRVMLVGREAPASFLINGQSVSLTPGVPSKPISSGDVQVQTSSGEAVGASSSGEAGNFLVVVFPNLKGGYAMTSIRDNMITFSDP